MSRFMARMLAGTLLAGVGLLAALGGCSAGSLGQDLPSSIGGLPAGTPAPPNTSYQYPAVHDMPPTRPDPMLSDEQQYKLEKDLQALRDRQETKAAEDPDNPDKADKPSKKAAAKPKTKPAAAKTGENTGAKTNP
jgi:hypothetical protein